MFLADAVAGYVESLTERELDAPLIALLYRLGYTHVHLVHGAYEFGKDIIARRDGNGATFQYCLQSKAGNLSTSAWRDLRQQVDAMRTGTVVHPDFDPTLPRKLVVITNGRLVGGAGVEFQDYNAHHALRGEAIAELWDIDHLVPAFEAVLVEGVPARDVARTLELFGRLGQGRGTREDVRHYATNWFNPSVTATERWSHVLNGAMLAREASEHGREDLAAQVAFLLIRAAWENPAQPGQSSDAELNVARKLFDVHAAQLWEAVRNEDPAELTTRSRSGLDAFVTHPVKAARLCEHLALLALLRLDEGDDATAHAITDYLDAYLTEYPAVAHVVSDEWAFSLLATVTLLLAQNRQDTVRLVVRRAAVWLLDKFEFGSGVAGVGRPPGEELRQLLGPAYRSLRPPTQPSSYAFTVILDLAHLASFQDLYEDVLNDLHAVDALACVVLDRGDGDAEYLARLEYLTQDEPPALHYTVPTTVTAAGAAEHWFDCLATWATLRDRHMPSVIARIVHG